MSNGSAERLSYSADVCLDTRPDAYASEKREPTIEESDGCSTEERKSEMASNAMDATRALFASSVSVLPTYSQDYALSVAVSEDGGWSTVVGTINGPPSLSGVTSDHASHSGGRDGFVATYSESGSLLWFVTLGTDGLEEATDVAIDADGSIFVSGYGPSNTFFNSIGGAISPTVVSSADVDGFIAKYDKYGVHQWTKWFGGDGQCAALSLTTSGDHVCGIFAYNSDAASPGPPSSVLNNGTINYAVLSLKRGNGVQTDIFTMGSPYSDFTPTPTSETRNKKAAIEAYKGKLFITAPFTGAISVYDASGNVTAELPYTAGYREALTVMSADLDGQVDWFSNFTFPTEGALGIALTANCGGVFVGGSFHAKATSSLLPGLIVTTPIETHPPIDLGEHDSPMIFKFDAATGEKIWHNYGIGGGSSPHSNVIHDIKADGRGRVFAIGTILGTLETEFASGTVSITAEDAHDIMMVALDANTGIFEAAEVFGGSQADRGYGLAIRNENEVIMVGVLQLIAMTIFFTSHWYTD